MRSAEPISRQAEEALEKQQTVSGILAYDISFISKESGEEVEPLEAVSVNIRMKKSVVSGQKERSEEKEATGVSVVHLPEDGKAEVVAATENIEETNFEFEAESFSIFVVATVAEVEEAAIVGDERFDTLQAAIDAVTGEDDVIYLLHDVTENIISKGKSYTLEMNEKKITSAVSGKIVYTIEGGNVLIKDGTIQGGRYQGTKNDGKGIKISGTANVRLENCCITDNKGYWSGGGIYADGNSILTLINSDVIGNYASNSGSGIYADGCEILNAI